MRIGAQEPRRAASHRAVRERDVQRHVVPLQPHRPRAAFGRFAKHLQPVATRVAMPRVEAPRGFARMQFVLERHDRIDGREAAFGHHRAQQRARSVSLRGIEVAEHHARILRRHESPLRPRRIAEWRGCHLALRLGHQC